MELPFYLLVDSTTFLRLLQVFEKLFYISLRHNYQVAVTNQQVFKATLQNLLHIEVNPLLKQITIRLYNVKQSVTLSDIYGHVLITELFYKSCTITQMLTQVFVKRNLTAFGLIF